MKTIPNTDVVLTLADTDEIEARALAAAEIEPGAKLAEIRAHRAAAGAADDFAAHRAAYEDKSEEELFGSCLVLGCGESSIPDVRDADNDDDNWTLARVLMPEQVRMLVEQSTAPGERWCVLVAGVDPSDLDGDTAVVAYRTIYDFPAALGACAGIQWLDIGARGEAIDAMREAGAIK